MRPVPAASVLLLAGIWVGGHPSVLSEPLADAPALRTALSTLGGKL